MTVDSLTLKVCTVSAVTWSNSVVCTKLRSKSIDRQQSCHIDTSNLRSVRRLRNDLKWIFCNSVDEHQTAPVVAVSIGGGNKTFQKAREILKSETAVLVFSETGGAADFIAGAYYTIQGKENTLVYDIRHRCSAIQVKYNYGQNSQ